MIDFPNLNIGAQEVRENRAAESQLTGKIQRLFQDNYGVAPLVRVSGSTQKGTALPKKYFGTDIDIAVQGNSSLVERIAYPNDVFEGCPLFSMDFFERFSREFPDVYFAGHRLSGTHEGWPFDFAIADSDKDKWKWDYNNSRFLDFTDKQREEAKKFKYFLKTFNLAGSEVNGVVGPALELMIYHHRSMDDVLKKIKELSPLEESFSDHFGTVLFPKGYYDLFPEVDDYIHRGLVDSFKFTTPNTFNRLIECARANPNSSEEFTSSHNPRFNYVRNIPSNHYKMLAHFLGTHLYGEQFFHIDILADGEGMQVYSKTDNTQRELLKESLDSLEEIPYNQDVSYDQLPLVMQEDLRKRLTSDPTKYTYFVGRPTLPLSKDKTYVPFDFLLREDCNDLVEIIEGGQNGSK